MEDAVEFQCPYCGQTNALTLERSTGGDRQELIMDCDVCCKPIQIRATYVAEAEAWLDEDDFVEADREDLDREDHDCEEDFDEDTRSEDENEAHNEDEDLNVELDDEFEDELEYGESSGKAILAERDDVADDDELETGVWRLDVRRDNE